MTTTSSDRTPRDLMNEAEQLIGESRQVYQREVDSLPVRFVGNPVGLTQASVLAAQASALIALAQARMMGQGRA